VINLKAKEIKIMDNLDKFVEIAKENKASMGDLNRYHNAIFGGYYVDRDARWQAAEKTFEQFNEFEFGKKIQHLDVNFFRDNHDELSSRL
jgi:hypothetical protein